jgi:hypothetical protein
MAEPMRTAKKWRAAAFGITLVIVPLLLLGLLTLIAMSPLPMRGAKMFGRIANAIKGHPGVTAYWTAAAGALLWLVIGGLVAAQEWRVQRRRAPER